jgi:hypothetical protein
MTSLLDELAERFKALAGNWTQYTVVGSFVLYLLGYLALRFHLTMMGVATDLAVLDERYLFTGARFVVYLVSAVPSIVLVLLLPALLCAWLWRALPMAWRTRTGAWLMHPPRLALTGVVFAVVAIQFVMRQCFLFNDLLLAQRLPAEPSWLIALLHQESLKAPYFCLLVAACLVSVAFLWPLLGLAQPSLAVRAGRALLAFLAAVQLLLLPVNYGVLIADKSLARLAAAGSRAPQPGETAWLVWEGKEGVTFLLRSADGQGRSLITRPRTEALSIEVQGFDAIIPALFEPSGARRTSIHEARR